MLDIYTNQEQLIRDEKKENFVSGLCRRVSSASTCIHEKWNGLWRGIRIEMDTLNAKIKSKHKRFSLYFTSLGLLHRSFHDLFFIYFRILFNGIFHIHVYRLKTRFRVRHVEKDFERISSGLAMSNFATPPRCNGYREKKFIRVHLSLKAIHEVTRSEFLTRHE